MRQTKQSKQFRQGDVFLVAAKVPPGERKKRADGVLAHGEVTGHAHVIADPDAAELYDVGDQMFLSVSAEGGVAIRHEEHGLVTIPPGDYQVRIQREYSPEEIRNVID